LWNKAGIDVNVLIDTLVRGASGRDISGAAPGSSPYVSRFMTSHFK
jgi:hypothetical protein